MSDSKFAGVDLVKELRLRRWARQNYVPADDRRNSWHPIVLDEMKAKDDEIAESAATAFPYVPLAPSTTHTIHGSHACRQQPVIAHNAQNAEEVDVYFHG
jgi:hypothetical protein